MKVTLVGLAALALMAASGAALAQAPPPATPPLPPPPARAPAMAVAVDLAQTAIATCAANGYKVTAVVLDAAGAERVLIVADGAASITPAIGTRKAITSLPFKAPSGDVGARVKTDPALAAQFKADTRLIPWAGGEPLLAKGELIGALGVSGAPGGDKDDACANAAIAKVKDRLS
jgi:uncharacterized protein GlcG (DUF336 family)